MSIISEYESHGHKVVVTVDRGLYAVTVDGIRTQDQLTSDDLARYDYHVRDDPYFLAGRPITGRVVYQIEGYCPPKPEDAALEREDGGAALIFHPNAFANAADCSRKVFREEPEHGMFVRVQSYDERIWERNGALPEAHDEIRRLFGKRVRVTVEVMDDED